MWQEKKVNIKNFSLNFVSTDQQNVATLLDVPHFQLSGDGYDCANHFKNSNKK